MTDALDDISTLEEAANYLKTTPARLTAMARAGKIGSLKHGRQRVFPRAVIEAYIEANTTPASPPNPMGLTDRGLARIRRR